MDAHAALIRSVLELNDPARRDAALALLDACIARTPRSAVCHYGAGSVLGLHVMAQGPLKAAMSARRIRHSLQQAVELDPSLYAARSALVQFYLIAPGAAGGSVPRAIEMAQAAPTQQPEQARVLRALIALDQKQPALAERELAAVRPGGDPELTQDADGLRARVAFEHLGRRQAAKARPIFERFIQEHPERAIGHYGLGRVLSDAQSWDEAIAELALAARLEGAGDLPIDYRLGIALQAKVWPDKARAALARFLAAGKGSQQNRDDAEQRLAELR
jgi:tetratricopeptide (TPR) repeat protein